MSVSDMASYMATLLAITLAPGPVALILIVRSASADIAGATAFGLGFALGGIIITAFVCFGLSAWITRFPETFEYSKYIMMTYLMFLAWRIWNAGFDVSEKSEHKHNSVVYSIFTGIFTCFISPYMMLLFPLVLPSLTDIAMITTLEFLLLWLITFLVLFGGSVLLIVFSAQIRHLMHSPRSMTILRGSLSCMLVIGGGWMALS